jgi:hypothetical protein
MRNKLVIVLLLVAVIGTSFVVFHREKQQQCQQRRKAVAEREAELGALAKQVPVGASKQEVEEFYNRNNMKFYFEIIDGKKDARGRVEMKSCSEHRGCGDDVGVVVEFKLDNDWRVISSEHSIAWLDCVDFSLVPAS